MLNDVLTPSFDFHTLDFGLNPLVVQSGFFLCLHILPMSAWVSSECSGFQPNPKQEVSFIGDNKLPMIILDMNMYVY